MVEYILGKYLVKNAKITKNQLQQVLEKLDSAKVTLALAALEEGILSVEQVVELIESVGEADEAFEAAAVGRGFFTEEQADKLLKRRDSVYLKFMQTLVDEQLILMEDFEGLLADFKRENGYNNAEMEDLKCNDAKRIVPLMLPEEAKQYGDIIAAALETMQKVIGGSLYMGEGAMVDTFPPEPMVSQTLAWESGFVSCFSERDGGLLKVCSVFGHEEFEILDEDAMDAAGELLNCVNGVYASELSRRGEFFEMMPLEYSGVRDPIRRNSICRVPIFVGDKGLYFTVAELI
ncbi:MAG: hypothetical protein NC417_12775 [Candidatus Gastranaerophilales bacterium]|nr:hypothetical protein [Candidatus Gastranaerophilales bacterium]